MKANKLQFHNAKAYHEKLKIKRIAEYKLDCLHFDTWQKDLKQYKIALKTLYPENYS